MTQTPDDRFQESVFNKVTQKSGKDRAIKQEKSNWIKWHHVFYMVQPCLKILFGLHFFRSGQFLVK